MYLAEKGVENSRLEAEWLLCATLALNRVGLYVNFDKPLSETELTMFRGMVARRARREPLQYILGSQEFLGLEFDVTPAVLIPRHDTEVLVESSKTPAPSAAFRHRSRYAVSPLPGQSRPQAEVYGVDSRTGHVRPTEYEKHGEGDLSRIAVAFPGRDSNEAPTLPRVNRRLEYLQPEVRDFEPRGALVRS